MSLADELSKLRDLRDSGALTEAEFEQAKAAVLNSQPTAPPQASSADPSAEQNALAPAYVWLRNLAFVLIGFGMLISLAWSHEARTIGRGPISTSLAPFALVSNIVGAILITVYHFARAGKGRDSKPAPPTPPPSPDEYRVVSSEVGLPKYPTP